MSSVRTILILFCAHVVLAQTVHDLPVKSAHDLALQLPAIVKGGVATPHWLGECGRFWFEDSAADPPATVLVDPESNTRVPYERSSSDQQAKAPELGISSPLGNTAIYLKDGNLWIRNGAGSTLNALTKDGTAEFFYGSLTSRADAVLWSPDGGVILAQKIDARGIPRYPVVTFYTDQNLQLPNEQVDLSKRLARAGERLPTPELVLIETASGQLKHVALTEVRDATIRFLGWPRESTDAFVLVTTRDAKRMTILGINGRTGVSREILADTSETFLMTPQGRYEFLFTSFSDGKRFLWGSERDGWRHLYLYRSDGRLLRRLTRGEFPVLRIVAVDEQQGWVYFTAHGEPRPYDTHLYRVDLEGKQVRRLTEGEGTHNVTFSPDRRYFVDNWSSISSPPIAELRTADGRLLQVLSRASLDYARRAGWTAPEEFVVKAADGRTDLYGVLYKPWNLIPTRKYPVIDMIYAGPLLTWVPHTFLGEPRSSNPVQAQALAQLGFIVMIVDARGTPERSKAFQDVVYGNVGRHEIPDHVTALQQLAAQRPYMDVARVGVIGHSWRGYFALRAMLMAPDLFKVGIAQAPVVDLWVEAPDIEPYMGLPQRNRNSYEYASNLSLADRLKGKLLLVHGTSDAGAPLSGTMRLLAALAKAGKPYDLVLLVHGRHNDAATSAYARERAEQYLVENLRSTP